VTTDGVAAEGDALVVDGVSVRFGGLRALEDVSLRVPAGTIVGLIGPNGAGKTTTFNTITGVVKPTAGTIRLFGQDVTGWALHDRARLGVGRTFQRLELFGSLTVLENLIVAAESKASRAGVVSDLLALPPTVEGRFEAEQKARQALETVGIEEYADVAAADLPLGLSRMVELARALCTDPKLLLLDEPSSGLRSQESQHLADYLRRTRAESGTSVLLVEHDMPFVLGLCDYVYVLDFGRLLDEGTPAEIRRSPKVQAAYLGEEIEEVDDDAVAGAR
jgi:branched-chain amino acid transport system ATP-binding protein